MCSPIAFSMVTQIGGGILQSRAARAEGESKQSYYNYLAGENEILARRTQQAAAEQGGNIAKSEALNEEELARSTARLRGTQRAVQAASGVWSDSGTASDVSRDTDIQESRDVSALRYNADSQIRESQRQADEQARALREQATGYRMSGESARTAGRIAANSTLIGTAANVASSYALWRAAATPKTTGLRRYDPTDMSEPNPLSNKWRPRTKLDLY